MKRSSGIRRKLKRSITTSPRITAIGPNESFLDMHYLPKLNVRNVKCYHVILSIDEYEIMDHDLNSKVLRITEKELQHDNFFQ